jgi:hypothetical protein
MRFNQVLFEHFVNAVTPEEKAPYAETVWDILQQAYGAIGGFKGAASAEELVHTPGLWKLSRRNGKIVAVALYKDMYGRKAIAFGTDGSIDGKRDFYNLRDEDLKLNRMWVEASGAIEKVLLKAGARPVPAKYASSLTGKEILSINPDGFHYTRLLQGHPYEKIIFGFVDVTQDLADRFEKAGLNLHELPDNMKISLDNKPK